MEENICSKVCPIPSEGTFTNPCIADECAWYDDLNKQCSIVTLAFAVADVDTFFRRVLTSWDEVEEDTESKED